MSYNPDVNIWRNRIVEHGEVDPKLLKANPLNWRVHPARQREATDGSLNQLGWIDEVTVNRVTGVMINGHLRVELAIERGEDKVPVRYVELSETEERLALAIFDPLTNLAETDNEKLLALLAMVEESPVEEEGVKGLLAMLDEQAGGDARTRTRGGMDVMPEVDQAEGLQKKWGAESGQLWRIGQHFVICGDSCEANTWQRLLIAAEIEKINGVFTSPPYAEQRKEQYGGVPDDQYVEWWDAIQSNVKTNLADDGSFFLNIKPHCDDAGERVLYVYDLVLAMKRRFGWRYVEEFIWSHQGTPSEPRRRFKNQFEPIYQFALAYDFNFLPENVTHASSAAFRKAGRGTISKAQGGGRETLIGVKREEGEAYPGNVISLAKNVELTHHPAAFPAGLPGFFIRAYSDRGDVWVDPFLGSGTTLVAAHQNQRIGLGIEKESKYMGIILERLEAVVGETPMRLEVD